MNWETTLLGEAPRESKVRESLCFGMSTFFDGVGSSQHATELHLFRGSRISAGQLPGLACPVVIHAAVVQIQRENLQSRMQAHLPR